MRFEHLLDRFDTDAEGNSLHQFASDLFPICRSITGNGVRRTLEIIAKRIPLEIREVPTGTEVFDWTVPREWNCEAATLRGPDGEIVADFADHNLQLMSYSVPVHQKMSLDELKPHLHSLPDHPDWIPYRTSYYRDDWGFCLPHSVLESLPDGEYDVQIDSVLQVGSLTYGECVLAGDTSREILISCHVCHPSMANDNLSGVSVTTRLAELMESVPRHYTYRFLFIPGTIGSITWLAQNEDCAERIDHGLVVTCVGDDDHPTYKRSRQGTAMIDRVVEFALSQRNLPFVMENFSPYGYDERQYCSPGFDLPVGLLTRSPWGRFPEYHSSADDLTFIKPFALADSLRLILDVFDILENDGSYVNLNPMCEPQLGKRGLYDMMGGKQNVKDLRMALLWVLNYSDGGHSLLEIAHRARLPFPAIRAACDKLVEAGLLKAQPPE